MAATLADAMQSYYSKALGKQGNLIDLEKEYFGGVASQSWNDAARIFYAEENGSSLLNSDLMYEAFKYYSALSGLTPVGSYSLQDHMYRVFVTNGGPGAPKPPLLTNLSLYLNAMALNGNNAALPADGAVVSAWTDLSPSLQSVVQGTAANKPLFRSARKNLLTYNQATVEQNTAGLAAVDNAPTIAKTSALFADGASSLLVTATATGATSAGVDTTGCGVSAGQVYTGVVAIAGLVGAGTWLARCSIIWRDAAGAIISRTLGNAIASTTSFQQVSASGTAPAGAVKAQVIGEMTGTVAINDSTYMDDLGLWTGTTTSWFPPTTLFGGKAAVQFDGANDSLLATLTGLSGSNYTLYVVNCQHAIIGDAGCHYSLENNTTKYVQVNDLGATNLRLDMANDAGTVAQSTDAVNDVVPIIQVITRASEVATRHKNGVLANTSSPVAPAVWVPTVLKVGFRSTGAAVTQFAAQSISAILLYATNHSSAERKLMEQWLSTQFSIAVTP